ncbi:hypothetical protein T484DRAFT_1762443, partial [Baffinella frigidus]
VAHPASPTSISLLSPSYATAGRAFSLQAVGAAGAPFAMLGVALVGGCEDARLQEVGLSFSAMRKEVRLSFAAMRSTMQGAPAVVDQVHFVGATAEVQPLMVAGQYAICYSTNGTWFEQPALRGAEVEAVMVAGQYAICYSTRGTWFEQPGWLTMVEVIALRTAGVLTIVEVLTTRGSSPESHILTSDASLTIHLSCSPGIPPSASSCHFPGARVGLSLAGGECAEAYSGAWAENGASASQDGVVLSTSGTLLEAEYEVWGAQTPLVLV